MSSKRTYTISFHADYVINFYEREVLGKVLTFFENERACLDRMIEIIDKRDEFISVRLVEHFVIRYTKKNKVVYKVQNIKGQVFRFDVYEQYNKLIDDFSKPYFDPYRRKEKLTLVYEDLTKKTYREYMTTTCQLNFMKWAIYYGIIDYIEKNYEMLYDDLKAWEEQEKKKKKRKT